MRDFNRSLKKWMGNNMVVVLFVLLCGTALAMLIWKRKQENSTEEFDEEKTEDFAE